MPALSRVSTTDMEVTSIRLERALKDKLKALAGSQGYQALIREVLWQHVEQCALATGTGLRATDIRASLSATAQRPEQCAITGAEIHPQEPMLLGLTEQGTLVPLSLDSLDSA